MPDSANLLNLTSVIDLKNVSANHNINTSTFDANGNVLNSSNGSNISRGRINHYSLQLVWNHKLNNKGRSIGIGFNGLQNIESNNSISQSKNIFYQSAGGDSVNDINQQILLKENNNSYSFNIVYNEPISKSMRLIFNESLVTTNSGAQKKTYNIDSNGQVFQYDTSYSGNFYSRNLQNVNGLLVDYKYQQWNIQAGITSFYNRLNNQSEPGKSRLTQKQFDFSPLAMISYDFNRGRNIFFKYTANTRQPGVDQLQPIPDNTNPLSIKVGNPNLKSSFSQFYSINYVGYDNSQNIAASLQYNRYTNKIINSVYYDNYRKQLNQFININGAYGLNGNFVIAKNFKREYNNKNISLTLNTSYDHDLSIINNDKIITKNFSISPQIGGAYAYKDMLFIDLRYSFSYNSISYDTYSNPSTKYILQLLNTSFTLNVSQFILESSLNYSYNNNVVPGFKRNSFLLNVSISRYLFRGRKGEIKLFVYDLLKQNVNILRTVSDNYIEDTQSTILQRYAMFSVIYHFKSVNNNKQLK